MGSLWVQAPELHAVSWTSVQAPKLHETHYVDRRAIWLHIDYVEWAMRYLYVQNLLKGVLLVPDDSTGPK